MVTNFRTHPHYAYSRNLSDNLHSHIVRSRSGLLGKLLRKAMDMHELQAGASARDLKLDCAPNGIEPDSVWLYRFIDTERSKKISFSLVWLFLLKNLFKSCIWPIKNELKKLFHDDNFRVK